MPSGHYTRPSLEQRFHAHHTKPDDPDACWIWTAAIASSGYGQISVGGQTFLRAHRVSWELHHGPIPDGLLVLHRCDNKRCVNPAHLFLGTHIENMHDMTEKGRAARGERNRGGSRLIESDVAEIRRRYAAKEMVQTQLAAAFGVSQAMISLIVRGEKWRP